MKSIATCGFARGRRMLGGRMFVLLTLAVLCVSRIAVAQVITGFYQDFNDGQTTHWITGGTGTGTYTLSADSNYLDILYNRTASSWLWDHVHFIPPDTVDVAGKPLITFRVRSTVGATLSFKPVYTDGTSSWLDYGLISDTLWRNVSLQIIGTGDRKVTDIYVYLDGGSTIPKFGHVALDDFRLGDSAFVVVSTLDLERGISSTQKLLVNSQEGSSEGQFPTGSRATLQSALDAANVVLASGTKIQGVIDQAAWDLYDACATFEKNVHAAHPPINDPLATKETRYLYMNMDVLAPNSLMFGMQDATGYGVNWSGDDNRSDVKDVCGDYPAVFAEDINKVELNTEVERMRYRLTSAYNRGAVISMVWHQYDPQGRGFYATDVNNERIVSTLIPGGSQHQYYKDKLKKMAFFMKSLRGARGESIPIIFRPYHEHVGNWFWWGPAYTTTQEYNTIWQFTETYLRDSLNVHNLLYALSPSLDMVPNPGDYFIIYPGDSYIDLFGSDYYFGSTVGQTEVQTFATYLRTQVNSALSRNKLSALTEVGQELLPTLDWFTRALLAPIRDDSINTELAYAAVWRNASTTHFYAPYPGSPNVPDFLNFYNDPYTLFEADLPAMYQYPVSDTIPPVITSHHDSTYVSPTTAVTLTVTTNERAYMRYALTDQPYTSMPNQFQTGERGFTHTVTIQSQQGQSGTIYVRGKDVAGNMMAASTVISYTVDTLEAMIAWADSRYPVTTWITGLSPIGTDVSAVTHPQPVRTIYFRTPFTLTQMPTVFAFDVNSYGGWAIYVNGHEVARVNLPTAIPLDYTTDPTSAGGSLKRTFLDSIGRGYLMSGNNELAIEVHVPSGNTVQVFNASALGVIGGVQKTVLPMGSSWTFFDKGYRPADRKLRDIINGVGPGATVPVATSLYPNFPNPFNPSTRIRYSLSHGTDVAVEVFDILGRRVVVLADEFQPAGVYEVEFHASGFASGVYLVRMRAGNFTSVQKMTLLK
jgi:mannan endo-1,4-beta-mannosidase